MKFLFIALTIFFSISELSAQMDIKFRFFANDIGVSKFIRHGDAAGLQKIVGSKFYNPKFKTVFYAHGFTHFCQDRGAKPVLEALIASSQKDTNFIYIDYTAYTCAFKEEKVDLTMEVFDNITSAIYETLSGLRKKAGGFTYAYGIGFGLGAYVVHDVGMSFIENEEYTIDRATILDVASEYIQNTFIKVQLDFDDEPITKDCAKFVDVIHTNGKGIGTYEPKGHVDFYVNGGRFQPRCQDPWKMAGFFLLDPIKGIVCDHQLAWEYFMESATNEEPSFLAYKCPSCYDENGNVHENFAAVCTEKTEVQMGYHADRIESDPDKFGCYYVPTNLESPYSKD